MNRAAAPARSDPWDPALPRWARVANLPFIAGVWLYRVTLSRITGRYCRFTPTCSQYALDAYHAHRPIRATRLTLWRLARCQPLARGGYDPVPLPDATAPATTRDAQRNPSENAPSGESQ